jgi:Flp pilus assembly protein TadG
MMNARLSLLRGKPSRQAMAEFAAVATVLLLLLFGIMEMGVVVYRYTTVSTAAREAARYAMVHGPTSENPATAAQVQAVAVGYAPFLSTTDVTVTFPADPTLPLQKDALVSISYNYTQAIPFMSAVPLTFTTSSQMLLSQ